MTDLERAVAFYKRDFRDLIYLVLAAAVFFLLGVLFGIGIAPR